MPVDSSRLLFSPLLLSCSGISSVFIIHALLAASVCPRHSDSKHLSRHRRKLQPVAALKIAEISGCVLFSATEGPRRGSASKPHGPNFLCPPPPGIPTSPPGRRRPMKEAMPVLTAGAGKRPDVCCCGGVPLCCMALSLPRRAARDAGPADLSAAARRRPQGGHGLPPGCLQRAELGIPDEGDAAPLYSVVLPAFLGPRDTRAACSCFTDSREAEAV